MLGTNVLEASIGRDLGGSKGVTHTDLPEISICGEAGIDRSSFRVGEVFVSGYPINRIFSLIYTPLQLTNDLSY